MAPAARGRLGRGAGTEQRRSTQCARGENAMALTGGWLVLTLTWDRWLNDWDGFPAEVLSALRSRGALA